MNKTKRVLSVVLAVLMLSSLIAALAIADGQHTVIIKYVFQDGKQAASPWTATLAEGSNYSQTVVSPMVVGYEPDQASIDVAVSSITENKTYTVTYKPAMVNFTVKHYLQNVDNDNYADPVVEITKGYTESAVGGSLAKSYTGFTALLYDTTTKIAADGSTVVAIYYDRNLYLMSFNLDGGYGVEPIYAKYQTPVSVADPTKPGYTFTGWDPDVPATVPAENTTYKAMWKPGESGFTVVFWYENANDNGYSYAGSIKPANVDPGTQKNSGDYQNEPFTGRDDDHFTYNAAKAETVTVKGDGSTVLNVYYTRNAYTLKFRELDCDKWLLHTHSDKCYKVVKTITAKYQADIHGNFPIKDGNNTIWWEVPDECKSFKPGTQLGSIDTMPGENITFTKDSSESGAKIYYYVETLDGQSGAYTHDGKSFNLYKEIDVSQSGYLTYTEEFHDIIGFRQYWSDPAFDKLEQGGKTSGINSKNYLCYTRNSYNLKFFNYNGFVTDEEQSVQYEAPLKDKDFTPAYPADLEANAYEFAGWYTTEGCFDGSEVKWDTAKMPAGGVVLYAKWAPKTHTVRTFLDKDSMSGTPLSSETVAHGNLATKPTDPKNDEYVFVGWFYEENGVEKAFDFSMPVVKDLNLYAKWSSNTLVTYTIRYVLEKDGTTVIADETTGSALAGTTKTFDAKTGTDLYESYQSGYFPTTNSHSIDMKVGGDNTYTFKYVARDSVNYTVKYLEKGTNKVLHEEKHGSTKDAVITEKFEPISGYVPDALQKRLVLSANEEENVIEFLYTKDEGHALVEVIHWTQNAVGDGYTEYARRSYTGNIDSLYSENPQSIVGYTYAKGSAAVAGIVTKEFTASEKLEAQLTNKGLTLNLYYDRVMVAYTVRHIDVDTGVEIAAAEPGDATRYGARVIGYAKNDIEGYMLTDGESQQKAIDITLNPEDNVITFRYHKYYKIAHVQNYEVVGTDTIRLTGSPENLTARVPQGYLYGGAFTNEACDADHVQTFTQGENAINFTPVKGRTYYIWEVSETYLKPRTYALWRHDPTVNGTLNVVGLYIMTHADRLYYQSVGFEIVGENATFANREVYQVVNAKKGDILYQQIYVNLQGEMAVSDTEVDATNRKAGYIAMYKLSEGQFATFVDKGLTFQPYWVTLDGIIVRGVNSRECGYKGPGQTDITVNNKDRIGSSVSNFATPSQQTVEAVSYYAFEAADVEVATPEAPATSEIPEVPEAPDMTLNSDAMYLRAQYTYEMMTNTVKFISAIDVNECTEYGFVINGEVVKCEEAAETVDGYDANYLFGGSVNGAMLMSCNMLLDGLVDGMTLNVTPYYVAADGTTVVYGETRTLVYRQWVGLEG